MTSISSSSLSSSLLQQLQQARQNQFQKADTDSNGGLSLEEFKAAGPKDAQGNAIAPPSGAGSVEDLFASIDSDGDGSLTQGELDAGFGQKAGGSKQSLLSSDMFSQLLSQLSDEETQAIFESADADGDGSLNQDEFGTAVEGIVTAVLGEASAGGAPAGGPPSGGGGGGGAGGGAEAASPTQVYDALDTNQDGTVSLDELLAANDDEEDSSSSILSLVQPSDDADESKSAFSAQALKTDFTKFLLSLQEQQYAA